MADIPASDITSGYVDGDGVFDLLMTAVGSHLKQEYEEGRIKGSDYANVYLGSMQSVLQQAILFLLQRQKADKEAELTDKQIEKTDAEICLLEAKCATEQAQIVDTVNGVPVVGLVGKQKNLYQKQADGFDRDAEQKALKLLVDMYSVAKSADPDNAVTMDWFATGSSVYDDFRLAVSAAVENAGLPQIYPNP
jgi:hypothetical protein